MLYSLTKAAHLISLFVWIGGMTAVALSLRYPALIFMTPLKEYDRAVTTPAMMLALLFGILLGVQGEWFSYSWLGMKILLVLALSALHGALVGKLRRATQKSSGVPQQDGRLLLPIGGILLASIVLLVIIKP